MPLELAGLTWPDVPEGALLVVPIGSIEQHGPHLPMCTDTVVASAVATSVTAELSGSLLAPTLPYGASGEHEHFPGTVSLGTAVLTDVLVEYVRSACRWAGRVLLVNGHGGNLDALCTAGRALRAEGRDIAWFACTVAGDAHAGRSETSLMLHLQPSAVLGHRAATGVTTPIGDLLPGLRAEGVRSVSPSGVLEDPSGASTEEGATVLAGLVARLVTAVERWHVDDVGRLDG